MPRQKKNQTLIKSLEELISDFDRDQLSRALGELELSLGWQVFKAALMKEYLSKVVYTLDNVAKTGKQIEAAYEAGSAQTMYDTANTLIDKYKDLLQNRSTAYQVERPQE